jgi:hypothetical protein
MMKRFKILILTLLLAAGAYTQERINLTVGKPYGIVGYTITKQSEGEFDFEMDSQEVVEYGGVLYAMGGWNPSQDPDWNNHIYTSTNKGITWTKETNAPWAVRHDFSLLVQDGKIRVSGGGTGDGAIDFWSYDPESGWVQDAVSNATFANRVMQGRCVHNGYIYQVAGANINNIIRSTNNATWSVVSTPPAEMQDMRTGQLVSFQGNLFFISGQSFGGALLGKVWKSEDDGVTWTEIAQHSRFQTYWGKAVATEHAIIYVCGRDNVGNVSGAYWSTDGISWTAVQNIGVMPARHALGMTATSEGEAIIVTGNFYNDSYIISPIYD